MEKKAQRFACIMAGGSGERFWPMSRARLPKHLLRLFAGGTLLEAAVGRAASVVGMERVLVLTNCGQVDAVRAAVPGLPPGNVLAEPAKRDTGPAAALATAIARARGGGETVLALLPADAVIRDGEAFRRCLLDGFDAAEGSGALVTFSIAPTYASTGFGYLELGGEAGVGAMGSPVVAVTRFVEKPDAQTAAGYVASGRHGWNAGMFVWRADDFVEEARKGRPELAAFVEGYPAGEGEAARYVEERFAGLPKISVDYAIMENAARVLAVRPSFDWDDAGTWAALPAHMGSDACGNTVRGPVAMHEARGNIAISNGRVIALCGVSDLVVVETEDALLVCHRDAVQDVKKLFDQLPESAK